MLRQRMLSVLLVMGLSACGGDSAGPSAPSAPVIPSYAGTWSGSYVVTGCTQSGGMALANICGSAVGQMLPFSMSLTQSGANVSGTFRLGTVTFTDTGGTVGSDGSLSLNGTTTSGSPITARWALRLSGSVLSGTVTQTWTSTTLSGSTVIVGSIATATR